MLGDITAAGELYIVTGYTDYPRTGIIPKSAPTLAAMLSFKIINPE